MANRRNALHIIRDTIKSQTARSVLGHLSRADLKVLADAGADKLSHPEVAAILGDRDPPARATKETGRVAAVLAKLPSTQLRALSTLYKNRPPECT